MSDKCHTKISNEKKHQEFERFYVRQTSDIREKVISKIL